MSWPPPTQLNRGRSRGVTLIELVYVIVIVGILAAALIPLALNGLRAQSLARQQVTTLDQTRYAMERLAREIREVRFTATQEAELSEATAGRLVFVRRGIAGGATSEGVTLAHSGTQLVLGYTAIPAQRLLDSVSRFELVYLDRQQAALALSNPPTAAQLAEVHAVRIEVGVSTPEGQTLSRQTVVQLKNRELL
jgi:prepilin-type N-terminal cleavage/methylation domain-containing protein